MLDLSGIQHAFQSAGFLRKLEQTLPLIFGERGLLERGAAGVLCGPGADRAALRRLARARSARCFSQLAAGAARAARARGVRGLRAQVGILIGVARMERAGGT